MDSSLVAPLASAGAAVLTSIVTVFATLGTTGRRLRSTLSHDVELLESLRGAAARDLRADVQRRAHLLVAQSRYPQVALYDALMVLIMLATVSAQIYMAYEMRQTPAGDRAPEGYDTWVPLVNLLIATIAFAGLTKSWTSRGANRLIYIFQTLGDDQAIQKAKVLTFPLVALPLLTAASAVIVGWTTYIEPLRDLELHPVVRWIGSLVATLGAAVAIWIVALQTSKPLNRIVKFYAPVPLVHNDSNFNFRPEELGGDPAEDWANLGAQIQLEKSAAAAAKLQKKADKIQKKQAKRGNKGRHV